jgi:hypothetical protein
VVVVVMLLLLLLMMIVAITPTTHDPRQTESDASEQG